ncbi:MAG: 3-methyl-2-oxobutanoate hydroxymethyltransferase [Rhodospirillales bacterium]|nr:3-methyl-2-oxobutanoate hydroxymethyltransferase [Rhodospirillales bacterium]
MRKTAKDIACHKGSGIPLVCLTAYTAQIAKLLDPHCDLLLVGDSMAMVLYGMDSTLGADMEMMIRHGQAVVRSSKDACVVVDMPFGSYQESRETAFRNAARIMKETGCQAVKVEGGTEMADTVAYLAQRGIPVMGHIGLQPQSVNTLGGYKARGQDNSEAHKIGQDARAIADAGAFAIVIEGVTEPLAAAITAEIAVPTIGIGASAACGGQVLVTEDMLSVTDGRKPRFVKQYAGLSEIIESAVKQYAAEVRSRAFPSSDYLYQKKAG